MGNLASYTNFSMNFCLAYTQFNALMPLITMREIIKGGREMPEIEHRSSIFKKVLYGIGIVVFSLASLSWFTICICQYPWYKMTNQLESYIFSIFFFILALMMIGGTIALNCIM